MKYALLDTDFISKTHTIKVDDDNHLIDRLLEMPGYLFACHEQTVAELRRHSSHASEWLEKKISSGKIVRYTDERLLNEISLFYNQITPYQFTNMIRVACNAFNANYFSDHYADLISIDYRHISIKEYLTKLKALDSNIGEKHNLGEIKAYILLQ